MEARLGALCLPTQFIISQPIPFYFLTSSCRWNTGYWSLATLDVDNHARIAAGDRALHHYGSGAERIQAIFFLTFLNTC